MNTDYFKSMLDLFGNPLFREGFADFFLRAQLEGIDAARKFWESSLKKDPFADNAAELYERMLDMYSMVGLVSKQKYEKVVREKEELAKENELLKDAIRQANLKIYTEGSLKAQEMWRDILQKQMEMGTELTKSFVDLFKPQGGK